MVPIVQQGNGLEPFISQVTVTEGDTAYNTEDKVGALVQAAAAGVWTLIWEKTVPAQRVFRIGAGSAQFPVNQGYISYGAGGSAANSWREGLIRIIAVNAAETQRIIVREFHSVRLHNQTISAAGSPTAAFPTDKQALTPLPEMLPDIVEDSKIRLEIKPDGAAVGLGKTNFIIPITVFA